MGKSESKEVVIAQTAAGAGNQVSLEDLRYHLSTTNILLLIFVVVATFFVIYIAFRIYRKCHLRWVRQEFQNNANRGSFFRRRPACSDMKIDDTGM